ncbi:MAG: GFA family protein [Pseudomonadota bacterium]
MKLEGGCYCGAIRYRFEGDAKASVQCHCRECQYFTGGHPNIIMALPDEGLTFTRGTPKTFARSDLETPRTRLFCGDCGTSIGTVSPAFPGITLVKVGTLDDPSNFKAEWVQYTIDQQPYHHLPEHDVLMFERARGG